MKLETANTQLGLSVSVGNSWNRDKSEDALWSSWRIHNSAVELGNMLVDSLLPPPTRDMDSDQYRRSFTINRQLEWFKW